MCWIKYCQSGTQGHSSKSAVKSFGLNHEFSFLDCKRSKYVSSKPITASDIYHLIWGPAEETVVSDTEIQNYIFPIALYGCTSAELGCRTDGITKTEG